MGEELPVERVRLPKFEWEKLMLISPLPFATRSVLMMLSPYMSEDGTRARPGIDNLVRVTGRGRSVLIDHLRAAVDAGYLEQVERGGFRGRFRGRRASTYAATVPATVYVRAVHLLHSPPWGRTSDGPDVDSESTSERPTGRTFTTDRGTDRVPDDPSEGPVLASEGPVLASERPAGRTPSSTYINQEPSSSSGNSLRSLPARESISPNGATTPDGRRARSWARHHDYEPNSETGLCNCGLPRSNTVAHKHPTPVAKPSARKDLGGW